jgi:threonine/homoserine/homoserine lactone efflux protein
MSITVALLAFIAAGSILIVTPGPDTALCYGQRRSKARGAAPTRPSVFVSDCWCGGLAAALGISAVLAASHTAYTVLRAIGAAWLVWLGANLIVRSSRIAAEGGAVSAADGGAPAWFWRGLLSNVTNPKVGVFFITFLPQFVPASVAVVPWIALLVVIHVTLSVIWLGFLIVATRSLGRLLQRPAVSRTLDRITGAVLIGAGLRLAVEGRR